MLSNVLVLPHNSSGPIVFAQQATPTAHTLRSFGQPSRPKKVSVVQKVGVVPRGQWMLPLVNDVASIANQVRRRAMQRGKQCVARSGPFVIANIYAKFARTHLKTFQMGLSWRLC